MKIGYWGSVDSLGFFQSQNWPILVFDASLEAGFQSALVDPDLSPEVLQTFSKEVPTVVQQCGLVDTLRRTKRGWAPQIVVRNELIRLLILYRKTLGVSQRLYIAGVNHWSRLFVLVGSQVGYREVAFIVREHGEASTVIRELERFCFGVKFQEVLHSALTLEPNNGSMLVSTYSPEDCADVIEDLTYLNFLSPSGLVVEVHPSLSESSLAVEAQSSGITYISPVEVKAFCEHAGLQNLGALPPTLTFSSYLKLRKSYFSSGNSPSV